VRYEHRLDLLPGQYRLAFKVDDRTYIYPLNVAPPARTSAILLASGAVLNDRSTTPFSFNSLHLDPAPQGATAMVQLAQPGPVEWRLRQGAVTVWKAVSEPSTVAIQKIGGSTTLPSGDYILEASTEGESQQIHWSSHAAEDNTTVISQNANLSAGERFRFIAHQWLTRGKIEEARTWLARAQDAQPSERTTVELARIDALSGHYDEARDSLRKVLAHNPNSFEALSALAYIEVQLQDYRVAETLYRQALALQPSPVIEQALAALSRRN
jgi:tetratricopeptide (TPR) repeat protein